MAPANKASTRSGDATASNKRKAAASAADHAPNKHQNTGGDRSRSVGTGDDDDDDGANGQDGDARAEPGVTKRTLQNRKAQREFRKRREARVRDLEERCRRFDQMGLEANAELQRAARRFKDENEALRGLLIRLGFGNMISSALQGLGNDGFAHSMSGPSEPSFAQAPAAAPGLDSLNMNMNMNMASAPLASRSDSSGSGSGSSDGDAAVPASRPAPIATAHKPTAQAPQQQQQPLSASSTRTTFSGDNVNPSMLQPTNGAPVYEWMNPVYHGAAAVASSQKQRRQSSPPRVVQPVASPADSSASRDEDKKPLLSLRPFNLNEPPRSATAAQPVQMTTAQIMAAAGAPGSGTGAGTGGSAMLDYNNPSGGSNRLFNNPMATGALGMVPSGSNLYPFPQRTQQNDALLNRNPIPFSFSMSGTPPVEKTWWDLMAGSMLTPGQDPSSLDEKAQVVAAAQQQASSSGAQSPFDLSTFLTGGLTPNGGYSLGGSYDSANGNGGSSGSTSGADQKLASPPMPPPLPRTEHAQMFLRLLERKVASRESPYASLGFQPPNLYRRDSNSSQPQLGLNGASAFSWGSAQSPQGSDDGAQRTNMPLDWQPGASPTGLTPNSVYSRLSQHPAFLTTSERELEELVDSIDTSRNDAASNGVVGKQQQQQQRSHGFFSPGSTAQSPQARQIGRGAQARRPSITSTSSNGSNGHGVELDQSAVDQLLNMLDAKRQSNVV